MGFLNKTTTGRCAPAPSIVIYGTPKIGKSTFASNAPSPLFIDLERGSYNLDVARIDRGAINNFNDIMTILRELYKEKHDYKTIVIDSIDWLERMLFEQIAKDNNAKSIDDNTKANLQFGKGYTISASMISQLLHALEILRLERGLTIILICHAVVGHVNLPDVESYDTFSLKLHKKNAAIIQEWAEVILFARQKIRVTTKTEGFNKKTSKGHSGENVLYTRETAAYLAGNRFSLEAELPLDWNAFWSDYEKKTTGVPTLKTTEEQETVTQETTLNDYLDL